MIMSSCYDGWLVLRRPTPNPSTREGNYLTTSPLGEIREGSSLVIAKVQIYAEKRQKRQKTKKTILNYEL
jgi:hypothetical protein